MVLVVFFRMIPLSVKPSPNSVSVDGLPERDLGVVSLGPSGVLKCVLAVVDLPAFGPRGRMRFRVGNCRASSSAIEGGVRPFPSKPESESPGGATDGGKMPGGEMDVVGLEPGLSLPLAPYPFGVEVSGPSSSDGGKTPLGRPLGADIGYDAVDLCEALDAEVDPALLVLELRSPS